MLIEPLPLAGAARITLQPRADARGAFARTFCKRELAEAGLELDVAQVNQSWNASRGTLRGMHYQAPPAAEIKLVRCIRGSVYDVIIDVRTGSPTFLQHHAEELSEGNMRALYIPRGFAHGFITLADDTELLYLHSEYYAPGHEHGLHYADPRLAIQWPITPTIMSEKDPLYPFITFSFTGISAD